MENKKYNKEEIGEIVEKHKQINENEKYNKEEISKIVEKHKQINENKKLAEEARKFINEVVETCEDFFQLNKYK